MLNILVSNDDGVHAEGLQVLVSALKQVARVTVMAPDRDASGSSNALTLTRPLYVEKTKEGFYSVNGTPTDCVHLAITGFLEQPPDLVISGINAGGNLGDDTLYSGTVAAAVEGRSLGYPSIAVSTVNHQALHFETAAKVILSLLPRLEDQSLPRNTILNINVPDLPYHALRGFAVTRLGHRHVAEGTRKEQDPRGKTMYWVGPAGRGKDCGEGTDFFAIEQDQVSVTPLQVDLTCRESLGRVETWLQGVS